MYFYNLLTCRSENSIPAISTAHPAGPVQDYLFNFICLPSTIFFLCHILLHSSCQSRNIAVTFPFSTLSFPLTIFDESHTQHKNTTRHMMHSRRATLFIKAVHPPAVLLVRLPGNYTITDNYHLSLQQCQYRNYFPLNVA